MAETQPAGKHTKTTTTLVTTSSRKLQDKEQSHTSGGSTQTSDAHLKPAADCVFVAIDGCVYLCVCVLSCVNVCVYLCVV